MQVDNAAVVIANCEDDWSFASSCISEFANIAKETQVPRLKLGTYDESGAGRMSCPEPERLTKQMTIDRDSTTNNACLLGAVSMQDLEIRSITIIKDTKSEEADSQFDEDTTSSHHGALSEGR